MVDTAQLLAQVVADDVKEGASASALLARIAAATRHTDYRIYITEGAASFPQGYEFWTVIDGGETVIDWKCGYGYDNEPDNPACQLSEAHTECSGPEDMENRFVQIIRGMREKRRV